MAPRAGRLILLDDAMIPPAHLVRLTNHVNRASFRLNGRRDTCILCSYALHYLLGMLLHKSRPVRVTAAFFPKGNNQHAVTLGSNGCGQRLPKASNGCWHGHLAVLVDEKWLCDPTADQANKDGISVPPLVIEMQSLDPFHATHLDVNGCHVRYNLFRKQTGFKHAPDSRPSHWMEIVRSI